MPHRTPDPGVLQDRLSQLLAESAAEDVTEELRSFLASVRAEDLADILGDLTSDQRIKLFETLPTDKGAEVLTETDPSSGHELVENLPARLLADLMGEMAPDDATDIFELVPEERRAGLLETLGPQLAGEIRHLIQHHPDTAGGIMTSEYVTVRADQTAREVLEILQRSLDTEVVSYVHVVDDTNHVDGVVSIREIIAARPEDPVSTFMEKQIIAARVGDDQEAVANLARKYNLKSIPVLDELDRLVGVVTVDDLLDIINDEADEDIYRMAGTVGNHPAHQKVVRRALVRAPWLLLPACSGFLVAMLSGQQSRAATTDSLTLLAFIPLVMGISGGAGTQSSTIMARGLATGEIDVARVLRVFLQELVVGLTIALCLGGLVGLVLYGALGSSLLQDVNRMLPVAVGVGLVTGIVLATISGTLLPIGCHFIRLDPALVAGPFVTSVNDVLAAFCYLGVGHVLLT